jgi:hypothetical protein
MVHAFGYVCVTGTQHSGSRLPDNGKAAFRRYLLGAPGMGASGRNVTGDSGRTFAEPEIGN